MSKKHRVAQCGAGSQDGLVVSATRNPVGRIQLRIMACGRTAIITVALMMAAIVATHERPWDCSSKKPEPPCAGLAVNDNIDDDDDSIDDADDSIDYDGINVDDVAVPPVVA